MLVSIHNKQHRKLVDSNFISNHITIKEKTTLFNSSSYLVKLVLNSYNILYLD